MNDTSVFREWLIKKLTRTRWIRYEKEALSKLSERLGVTEAVLIEAQAVLDQEQRAAGQRLVHLGSHKRQSKRKFLDLEMPETVLVDWKAYCAARDIVSSVLLRSLIHTLLSTPKDPAWVQSGWRYRGKMHRMVGYKALKRAGKQWPHGSKTDVSQGAARALVLRAQRARCTQTALLRGMAIDLLEGKLKHLQIVTMASQMWDDERRYWVGPG